MTEDALRSHNLSWGVRSITSLCSISLSMRRLDTRDLSFNSASCASIHHISL
jgi:hypothetical protein